MKMIVEVAVRLVITPIMLFSQATAYLDVEIDQGTVRGYDHDHDQVFSFYGIPYATAPKGVNKFKDSLPPPTWTTILNATDNNTICLQQEFNSDAIYTFRRTHECLKVNVFVPKTKMSNLPVLVNIHGGALLNGYGAELSPIELVASGIVAVTFNYRLGILGFMCLNTDMIPGNAAMKDQVAALKWVQNNIRHFGGDPNRVTISGSSSATANVEHLILSPLSQGLFHQAITESGSATTTKFKALDHLRTAIDQASSMGASLQTIEDVDIFYTTIDDELFNSRITTSGFIPCIETHNIPGVKKFLTDEPIDILMRGDYNKVPMITGFAPKEGQLHMILYNEWSKLLPKKFISFLPNSISFRSQSKEEASDEIIEKIKDFYFPTGKITKMGYIDYFTDSVFIYPQYLFARLNSRNKRKEADTFLYLFTFRGNIALPDVDKSIGLGHIPETLYIFDYDIKTIYSDISENDRLMRKKLREYYYNFLKYGNPNSNKPKDRLVWLPFTEENYYYLEVDLIDKLKQRPLFERLHFWDTIYNKILNLTEEGLTLGGVLLIITVVVALALIFVVVYTRKNYVQFTRIPLS